MKLISAKGFSEGAETQGPRRPGRALCSWHTGVLGKRLSEALFPHQKDPREHPVNRWLQDPSGPGFKQTGCVTIASDLSLNIRKTEREKSTVAAAISGDDAW